MSPTEATYGSWKSPITSDLLTSSSVSLSLVGVDAVSRRIFWLEGRPSEKGRVTLLSDALDADKRTKGSRVEHTPEQEKYSVRSRVHEYGGGAATVVTGKVVFSNSVDDRLYLLDGETIKPLTNDTKKIYRYADMAVHPSGKFIVSVREDHTEDTPATVVNTLVAIDLANGEEKVLVSGNDFYSSPAFNPKSEELAYVTWNHPNMPWDNTQLHLAKLDTSLGLPSITEDKIIAGEIDEAPCTPTFTSDGTFVFTTDRTGFWNFYSLKQGKPELVLEDAIEAEFDDAHWIMGVNTFVPLLSDPTKIFSIYLQHGIQKFAIIDSKTKSLKNLDIPLTTASTRCFAALSKSDEDIIVFQGASYTTFSSIFTYSLKTSKLETVIASSTTDVSKDYFPKAESITFPTTNGQEAYAYYYPPTNPDFVAPKGELPPVRVVIHGGPTSRTKSSIALAVAFWTSRGIGLLDVNYGGSTGYGREFRNRLRKSWGVVDVDDASNAAEYLVKQGRADPKKLVISGGSAGGFTVLACLAFKDTFAAGCSAYGVADITLLAQESHKFESFYPVSLIGEYPKDKKIYEERSPINSVDTITCPCIFFQGDEDKVVPPSQAEIMVDALKKKGIPVSYTLFKGEGHGFRQAQNIRRCQDGELHFYGKMLDFKPADPLDEPLPIDNWPQAKH